MALTMRGAATMTFHVPADELDLESWLFGLSDAEYQACARGHQGAGVYTDELGRGMVNVESIGGNLIVQHYRPVEAGPAATEMYSSASRVYLLHLVPVRASVRWLLTVAPVSDTSSELTCTVDVGLHPVLRVLGGLMAAGTFLQRHVDEEIAGFVADITRKHRAARSTPQPASLKGTQP